MQEGVKLKRKRTVSQEDAMSQFSVGEKRTRVIPSSGGWLMVYSSFDCMVVEGSRD